MDLHLGRRLDVAEIQRLLEEARARTLDLLSTVSEVDQRIQHDGLMSPVVWDLGHIAHFEEVWLGERSRGSAGYVQPLRESQEGQGRAASPRRCGMPAVYGPRP